MSDSDYDAERDSFMSWQHAIAELRLRLVEKKKMESQRKWLVTRVYNGRKSYAVVYDQAPRLGKEDAGKRSVRELKGEELTMRLDDLIEREEGK